MWHFLTHLQIVPPLNVYLFLAIKKFLDPPLPTCLVRDAFVRHALYYMWLEDFHRPLCIGLFKLIPTGSLRRTPDTTYE